MMMIMRCPVVTILLFVISSVVEVNSFSIPSSPINKITVLRSTTDNASIAVDLKDDIDNRIEKVLAEKRQEFLSDNNGNEQLARELLLSSRLPGLNFLNRSEVRPSRILGAGRGLFATEGIPKGQVVTCYPGDALLTKSAEYNDLLGAHTCQLRKYGMEMQSLKELSLLRHSHPTPVSVDET